MGRPVSQSPGEPPRAGPPCAATKSPYAGTSFNARRAVCAAAVADSPAAYRPCRAVARKVARFSRLTERASRAAASTGFGSCMPSSVGPRGFAAIGAGTQPDSARILSPARGVILEILDASTHPGGEIVQDLRKRLGTAHF